jgi:hypothetical protein
MWFAPEVYRLPFPIFYRGPRNEDAHERRTRGRVQNVNGAGEGGLLHSKISRTKKVLLNTYYVVMDEVVVSGQVGPVNIMVYNQT